MPIAVRLGRTSDHRPRSHRDAPRRLPGSAAGDPRRSRPATHEPRRPPRPRGGAAPCLPERPASVGCSAVGAFVFWPQAPSPPPTAARCRDEAASRPWAALSGRQRDRCTRARAQPEGEMPSRHGFLSGRVAHVCCGSPSQQPILNRHLGHCQVPCSQRISTPHRQHASELTAATLENAPDAAATLGAARRRSSAG